MKFLFSLFLVFIFCSRPVLGQKTTIAVLDLKGMGISEIESSIISSRLRTDLFNTNKFTVVEREKMKEILNEQGFQISGCTSDECIVEAGKLLGVKQIVAGEIGKLGNLYTLTIRLVDVETGQLIKTATHDCECKIEEVLLISVREVANKLSGNTLPANTSTVSQTKASKNTISDPKIKNPEIRYAKSLFKRKKHEQAKKILAKFLNGSDYTYREEAMAYNILWSFAADRKEEYEKFKAFYPSSPYVNVIKKKFELEEKAALIASTNKSPDLIRLRKFALANKYLSIRQVLSGNRGKIYKIANKNIIIVEFKKPDKIVPNDLCFILKFRPDKNRFEKIGSGKILKLANKSASVELIDIKSIEIDDICVTY